MFQSRKVKNALAILPKHDLQKIERTHQHMQCNTNVLHLLQCRLRKGKDRVEKSLVQDQMQDLQENNLLLFLFFFCLPVLVCKLLLLQVNPLPMPNEVLFHLRKLSEKLIWLNPWSIILAKQDQSVFWF